MSDVDCLLEKFVGILNDYSNVRNLLKLAYFYYPTNVYVRSNVSDVKYKTRCRNNPVFTLSDTQKRFHGIHQSHIRSTNRFVISILSDFLDSGVNVCIYNNLVSLFTSETTTITDQTSVCIFYFILLFLCFIYFGIL